MSTLNHVFSAFSFISFVLVIISSPRHLKARTTAPCLYIFWVSLSNLSYFINSIIWDGNVHNKLPVWCDITGRQIRVTDVAVPATCLCIQRLIHNILSNPLTVNTTAQKRRMLIWDLLLGLCLPLLSPIFIYIVQPHRYVIVEDFGCRIFVDNTALALVLIFAWVVILCLICGFYSCLNIYHIWTKRRELRSFSDGSLGPDHYIRLFMISGIDIFTTIPINLYFLTTWFPVSPWPGWKAVHSTWSQIPLVTAAEWRTNPATAVPYEMDRWTSVIYGLVFFIFFGLGWETRKSYVSCLRHAVEKVGHRRRTELLPLRFRRTRSSYVGSRLSASDSFRTPHTISSIIAPSIASDLDSNHEMESDFVQPVASKQKTSVSQQFDIVHVLTSAMSSDPESGGGVER